MLIKFEILNFKTAVHKPISDITLGCHLVPAHVVMEGNDLADNYAKDATKKSEVKVAETYSKALS